MILEWRVLLQSHGATEGRQRSLHFLKSDINSQTSSMVIYDALVWAQSSCPSNLALNFLSRALSNAKSVSQAITQNLRQESIKKNSQSCSRPKLKTNSQEDRMQDYTLIIRNLFSSRKKNTFAETFEDNSFGFSLLISLARLFGRRKLQPFIFNTWTFR